MRVAKERFIVDEKGEKESIVLNLSDYLQLVEHLEDLEDALDLDKAEREAKSFRDYKDIRAELVKKGRL